jgi:hypothetical protein
MTQRLIKSIAIYCGSNFGNHAQYAVQAKALGAHLANQQITLIYGGTRKGLMGVVADAALENGGQVIGIIPQNLFEKGQLHPGLKSFEVVENLQIRKSRMEILADAFIALPGGYGTLEELFQVLTLIQLELMDKPCCMMNIESFYDPLYAMLINMTNAGFLKKEHMDMLLFESDVHLVLLKLSQWVRPHVNKWIDPPQGSDNPVKI